MGRWWRYKWITFHPSLTVHCGGQQFYPVGR
nr:MAG TPA: 3-oxoacyl-(acyl carrier protein) synthase II [Caudoviricetes sp.]